MVFKLCQSGQKKWRKLDGSSQLAEIIHGAKFINGGRRDRVVATVDKAIGDVARDP